LGLYVVGCLIMVVWLGVREGKPHA
jgi:hypothetical protein